MDIRSLSDRVEFAGKAHACSACLELNSFSVVVVVVRFASLVTDGTVVFFAFGLCPGTVADGGDEQARKNRQTGGA
jgi:hypothetical protein